MSHFNDSRAHVYDNGQYLEITLQHGLVTFVDYEDRELVTKYSWTASKRGNTYYTTRSTRNPLTGRKLTVQLHSEILGAQNGQQIDHVDGNGLNNLRSNIRFATHTQNARNRGPQANNKTGVKGVYYDAVLNRYIAQIKAGPGRQTYLGSFVTATEGAAAYDRAAVALFGEFAKLNNPANSTATKDAEQRLLDKVFPNSMCAQFHRLGDAINHLTDTLKSQAMKDAQAVMSILRPAELESDC